MPGPDASCRMRASTTEAGVRSVGLSRISLYASPSSVAWGALMERMGGRPGSRKTVRDADMREVLLQVVVVEEGGDGGDGDAGEEEEGAGCPAGASWLT